MKDANNPPAYISDDDMGAVAGGREGGGEPDFSLSLYCSSCCRVTRMQAVSLFCAVCEECRGTTRYSIDL